MNLSSKQAHAREPIESYLPVNSQASLSNPFCFVLKISKWAQLSIAGAIVTFWGMRKMPYFCPICGEKFGNKRSSRAEQRQHFQTFHPGFFDWNNRFCKIGKLVRRWLIHLYGIRSRASFGRGQWFCICLVPSRILFNCCRDISWTTILATASQVVQALLEGATDRHRLSASAGTYR